MAIDLSNVKVGDRVVVVLFHGNERLGTVSHVTPKKLLVRLDGCVSADPFWRVDRSRRLSAGRCAEKWQFTRIDRFATIVDEQAAKNEKDKAARETAQRNAEIAQNERAKTQAVESFRAMLPEDMKDFTINVSDNDKTWEFAVYIPKEIL